MNTITASITGFTLSQAETSTATWVVLMVVVGALVSGVFAVYRVMANKLTKSEDRVDASESKVADARHAELKSMVKHVGDDVNRVGGRMDKMEGRVTQVEIGLAKHHQEIQAIKGAQS